jgi:branched-chain amino acid transport system substrate-binding protein
VRSRAKVVATQRYDPAGTAVEAEVGALRPSGADVLAVFATSPFATQAYAAAAKLGWRPLVLASSEASAASGTAAGAVSISFLEDPLDPRRTADAGVRLYRRILARYARGADPRDAGHLYGMAVAWTVVELLERTGSDPTRAELMALARSMRIPSNPFLRPGIGLRTGNGDGFPLDQAVLRRWTNGRWQAFGGLWQAPST